MQTEQANLTKILRFVHLHYPPMAKIADDHVEAWTMVSIREPFDDVAGEYCERAELRTMREARDWLGY